MKRIILTTLCLVAIPLSATAQKPSVNVVQECQAVLDFTIERVAAVKSYDKADVKLIRGGLTAYNNFLQSDHVTPGLLEFTSGDAKAAKGYQVQIDTYKAQIVKGLKAKHPQNKIFTDQAVAINNCYQLAPMGADKTEKMKTLLETIIKLAQQG